MVRRTSSMALLAAALFLVTVAVPATGAPPGNPFVGSWESFDDFVATDGFHDTSHVRLQISNSGKFHLRDDGANVCREHPEEYGFVPGTIKGTGVLTTDGTPMFEGSGDLYCYPRDGRGRALLGDFPLGPLSYDAASDTIGDGFNCYWRTGRGDPSDCG